MYSVMYNMERHCIHIYCIELVQYRFSIQYKKYSPILYITLYITGHTLYSKSETYKLQM